eukprot:15430680-Alexandrium_andersonii.AAC.1
MGRAFALLSRGGAWTRRPTASGSSTWTTCRALDPPGATYTGLALRSTDRRGAASMAGPSRRGASA